jgi:hypothetical protein
MINRAYEQAVNAGKVGLTGEPWSQSTERRHFPDCARGGCHRPASRQVGKWLVCNPCADAIEQAQ